MCSCYGYSNKRLGCLSPTMSAPPLACAACGSSAVAPITCPRCHAAFYCSAGHQLRDALAHRGACSAALAAAADAAAADAWASGIGGDDAPVERSGSCGGWVAAAARSWFSSTAPDGRSERTLEREQWLFPGIPATGRYTKWHAVLPVLLVQLAVGSFYSTSVFNAYNDARVWGSPGSNALMFVSVVGCYGTATLLLGVWVGRRGVFAAVSRALLLTPLGWVAASLACTLRVRALLFLYGVLHGTGCALMYISSTSMMQQWHPLAKGAFAGAAVFGAGLGSLLWTLLGRALMAPPYDYTPAGVMLIIAAASAGLIVVALPFLRYPPPGYTQAVRSAAEAATGQRAAVTKAPPPQRSCARALLSPGPPFSASADQPYDFIAAVSTREFRLLSLVMFGCSLPGVVFLSSAADMAQHTFELAPSDAALVAAALNAVNFGGRFVYGAVSDVLGRKAFWILCGAVQSIALGVLAVSIRTGAFAPWLAAFLLVGSLYGGLFGVLPAFVSDMWGAGCASGTHGVCIAVWALACVVGAPVYVSVNAAYSARGLSHEGYAANATWLAFLPALALVACAFMNARAEDRAAEKATGTWRVRLWSDVAVFHCQRRPLVSAGGGDALPRRFLRRMRASEQEAEYVALGLREIQLASRSTLALANNEAVPAVVATDVSSAWDAKGSGGAEPR